MDTWAFVESLAHPGPVLVELELTDATRLRGTYEAAAVDADGVGLITLVTDTGQVFVETSTIARAVVKTDAGVETF